MLRNCCAVIHEILTLIGSVTSLLVSVYDECFMHESRKCSSGKLYGICLYYACLSLSQQDYALTNRHW